MGHYYELPKIDAKEEYIISYKSDMDLVRVHVEDTLDNIDLSNDSFIFRLKLSPCTLNSDFGIMTKTKSGYVIRTSPATLTHKLGVAMYTHMATNIKAWSTSEIRAAVSSFSSMYPNKFKGIKIEDVVFYNPSANRDEWDISFFYKTNL